MLRDPFGVMDWEVSLKEMSKFLKMLLMLNKGYNTMIRQKKINDRQNCVSNANYSTVLRENILFIKESITTLTLQIILYLKLEEHSKLLIAHNMQEENVEMTKTFLFSSIIFGTVKAQLNSLGNLVGKNFNILNDQGLGAQSESTVDVIREYEAKDQEESLRRRIQSAITKNVVTNKTWLGCKRFLEDY